jgi:hypothetical protein
VQPPVKQSTGQPSKPARGGDRQQEPTTRATEASAYADSLRATLSAQKQAEQMLAVATRVRGEAAAQGERILVEAQEAAMRLQAEAEKHAERARAELSAWAAAQRKAVDAAIGEVIDAARQEAERVRSEAVQSAMAEAAKRAGQQVADSKAAGRREAERIQSDAVRLLTHSRLLLSESRDTLLECATVMAEAADSFRARADLTESLLGQVGPEPATTADDGAGAGTQPKPATKTAGAAKAEHGRPLGSLFHGGDA